MVCTGYFVDNVLPQYWIFYWFINSHHVSLIFDVPFIRIAIKASEEINTILYINVLTDNNHLPFAGQQTDRAIN